MERGAYFLSLSLSLAREAGLANGSLPLLLPVHATNNVSEATLNVTELSATLDLYSAQCNETHARECTAVFGKKMDSRVTLAADASDTIRADAEALRQ